MEELYRLEKVPTRRVPFPIEGVEVNEPLEPEILEKVTLELYGQTYPPSGPHGKTGTSSLGP